MGNDPNQTGSPKKALLGGFDLSIRKALNSDEIMYPFPPGFSDVM
jgi:hypothetical protein